MGCRRASSDRRHGSPGADRAAKGVQWWDGERDPNRALATLRRGDRSPGRWPSRASPSCQPRHRLRSSSGRGKPALRAGVCPHAAGSGPACSRRRRMGAPPGRRAPAARKRTEPNRRPNRCAACRGEGRRPGRLGDRGKVVWASAVGHIAGRAGGRSRRRFIGWPPSSFCAKPARRRSKVKRSTRARTR